MSATAARILLETLKLHGVDRFFCVPGESYLSVFDELVDDTSIDVVTCRHESGAGFMAVADAKCTGRPGVFFASRGPGATNASVAIHSAHQGGIPLVACLGQIGTRRVGNTHTQEMDFSKTFADMAKHVEQVNDPSRMAEIVARAFRIATTGKPGPVIVALPTDVLAATVDVEPLSPTPATPVRAGNDEIEAVADILAKAERPVLIAGGLVHSSAGARDALLKVSERYSVPVMPTFEHQDVFPHEHPNYAGELGIRPPPDVKRTATEADVIVAVGSPMTGVPNLYYSIPGKNQRFIHVYPDPHMIGTVFRVDQGVVSDPEPFLRALSERNPPAAPEGRANWISKAHMAWETMAKLPAREADDGIDFAHVIDALALQAPDDAIITSDAGNFASWLHHRFPFKSTQLLLGSEIGAMGMGIPAGVAAAIRFPDRQVFALAGDGGALMTGSELATAVMRKARVRVIVSNNAHYGTIRFHQEIHYPSRTHYANELVNPDFAAYGEAFGAKGFHIDTPEDAVPVIAEAMQVDGPAIIEVRTSLELNTSYQTIGGVRAAAGKS